MCIAIGCRNSRRNSVIEPIEGRGKMMAAAIRQTYSDDLYATAYAELRRVARRERCRVHAPQTLDTTALVHEAWLKLHRALNAGEMPAAQFLALAARAMRQALIDYARRRQADKRHHVTVTLDADSRGEPAVSPVAVVALDEAMRGLETLDPRLARIVDLHVFAGLDFKEIAGCEELSESTVYRLWRSARVYLLDQLLP